MRPAIALLIVLVTGPAAWGQPRDKFPTDMANAVFTAALEFIAPRALDAITIQQLAVWGLRGVNTLDPALMPQLADGIVTLQRGPDTLFRRAAPAEADSQGWGTLASDLMAAAWGASPTLQSQGGQALMTSFFDEIFNHLDPYSRYVAPEAADEDRARRSGEAGAGITVSKVGANFVVQTVNADGPAADADIQPGDRIIAVDDQPTRGEDLDTVLGWISGIEGTDLALTVRGRNGRLRTVDLEREILPPETVFTSRIGDVVLVRITAFASDTDQRLAHDLEDQFGKRAVPRALVLDLRGNRGGLLRQAVTATGLLIDSGIIANTAGRDPQAAHVWEAGPGGAAKGRPVIVLVDGRTASASEIMAAAIAGLGRGVIVGSSTLGKGLVQTITTLPDGGELFVSWSRVLAPGGWPIQGLGVLPQVCTSLGAEQLNQELASLEKGTSLMEPALARHREARAPLPSAEIVEQRSACPAAEGRDADLTAAKFLIAHPNAYNAALLSLPPP